MRSLLAWLLCAIATVLDELAWKCWNLALKYEDFDSMKTLEKLIEEIETSDFDFDKVRKVSDIFEE